MPGTVISLRDTSSSRARRAISLSRSAILPLKTGEQDAVQSQMLAVGMSALDLQSGYQANTNFRTAGASKADHDEIRT
jgi:hypothetical protein